PWGDVHRIAGVVVVARYLAAVRPCVDDLRIARVGRDISALTSTHRIPAGAVDAAPGGASDADRAVVLLRSVNPIGETIVGHGMVNLRRRLVRLRRPARAAIGAYVGAAVVRFDHAVGILGIDPQTVVIAMRHADRFESFAPVVGAIHACVQYIDAVSGAGIGEDVRVIESALAVLAVAVDQRPGVTAIIGPEQPALIVLDERPDAVTAVRHSYADASGCALRQAMPGEPFPCGPGIGAAREAAAAAAPRHLPRPGARL